MIPWTLGTLRKVATVPNEIVVTLKADGAPWVVVHGETGADVERLLAEAGQLVPKVVEAAVNFRGSGAPVGNAGGNRAGGGGYKPKPQGGGSGGGELTHILYVPFDDAAGRQELKDQGARWDKDRKGWKVSEAVHKDYPKYHNKG
jgi:hypothetical protein